MTEEKIQKMAIELIGGNKIVRIGWLWEYKKKYSPTERLKTIALVSKKDQIRIAMPHLESTHNESYEFRTALKVIKGVDKIKNAG